MKAMIERAKLDFIAAAGRAYTSGMQSGNGGNISVRVGDSPLMAIKASGVGFGESSIDSIVVTDLDGKLVEGDRKPTREIVLHGALYRRFPEIGAVVHTHTPYSIAWSFTGRDIPLITWHARLKMPGPIPVLAIDSPEVTAGHIPLVYSLLEGQPALRAFVLQGHGIVAFEKSAVLAEQVAELVEETAKIAWLHAVGQRSGIINS
jgi:L-ribulose-5-phosphate 4-epimerase